MGKVIGLSMYYETGVKDALREISMMIEFGDVEGAQRAVKELLYGSAGCDDDGDEGDDEAKTMGELFEITEEEYNDGRVPAGWTEVGGPTE